MVMTGDPHDLRNIMDAQRDGVQSMSCIEIGRAW